MSKFKKAIEQCFEEWCEEIEQGIKKAKETGELPQQTEEERKAAARKIWEQAHKEK